MLDADDLRSFSINSPALVHDIEIISMKEHREGLLPTNADWVFIKTIS
jgi:hypothetical protein